MNYYVTDRTGKVHKFDTWGEAVKFAIQQANLPTPTPVYMQWGESNLFKYQVWANGDIDRLEKYCACDQCNLCTHSGDYTTCPHYWAKEMWEYYDTVEL